MTGIASERAYQLRNAVVDMTLRYGDTMHCLGLAVAGPHNGKPRQHWHRAARRQLRAIMRLTAALRDVDVTR